MSSVTPKTTGEVTKAILKGSTQNINSSTLTLSTTTTTTTKSTTAKPFQTAPISKPETAAPEQSIHVAEMHHSPVGQRMSSGSSGYSATDDVDYLKWISESATRPRQNPDFAEKRPESGEEESSGCSPDGVESPDTMREEVTPSPQRSSSPDSGYEHGNGTQGKP